MKDLQLEIERLCIANGKLQEANAHHGTQMAELHRKLQAARVAAMKDERVAPAQV